MRRQWAPISSPRSTNSKESARSRCSPQPRWAAARRSTSASPATILISWRTRRPSSPMCWLTSTASSPPPTTRSQSSPSSRSRSTTRRPLSTASRSRASVRSCRVRWVASSSASSSSTMWDEVSCCSRATSRPSTNSEASSSRRLPSRAALRTQAQDRDPAQAKVLARARTCQPICLACRTVRLRHRHRLNPRRSSSATSPT